MWSQTRVGRHAKRQRAAITSLTAMSSAMKEQRIRMSWRTRAEPPATQPTVVTVYWTRGKPVIRALRILTSPPTLVGPRAPYPSAVMVPPIRENSATMATASRRIVASTVSQLVVEMVSSDQGKSATMELPTPTPLQTRAARPVSLHDVVTQ